MNHSQGLDPVQMKLLENVIVEFHKKEKGIYIISSHDIECLQNVCDKCLLLHNGQIREINMEEVDREKIAKILSEGNKYVSVAFETEIQICS